MKEGTLKFLGRCLSTSSTPVQPGQIKLLTDPLSTLLEDSFEGARNEAAMCLGTLMKMVGERPLNALMDGLADVRKAKVKEAYEKATVKCKAGSSGPSKPPPTSKEVSKKPPTKPGVAGAATSASSLTTVDGLIEEPPSKPKGKPPAKLMVRWRRLKLIPNLTVTVHRRRKVQREQLLLGARPAQGVQIQHRKRLHPLRRSHHRQQLLL